ncbi:MAG: peptidyl-prolyl cis-trans isomerase [Deltaproteobacteria bacterium]|jgi:peptidyl-prolyl cis-trans isomerase C|nr:peptidyl-prolyl cis-trans isomerase [Deltaproteobacteria bacterium]
MSSNNSQNPRGPALNAAPDKASGKSGIPASLVLKIVVALCAVLAVAYFAVLKDSGTRDPGTTASESGPGALPAPPPPPEGVDEPIATVNGRPVSRKNYNEMLGMSQSQQALSGQEGGEAETEPSMDLRLGVLDSLISLNLAIQKAYELGFGPGKEEIDDGIGEVMGNYGNPDEIENVLKTFGTDIETVRAQVADSLAIRSWRDTAFIKEALATDEEARAFYDANMEEARHPEQVRAIQIMLPVPLNNGQEDSQARERVRARAEAIYKEALDGANFEELMERNMDQTTRAAIGSGQMGWINRGESGFNELEEVIFNLKPGEIGGPVESQFSYHIVKVVERRDAGVMSFEELKSDIMEYLLAVKTDQLFLKTISDYRQEAKVEIFDEAMAAEWPAYLEKQKTLAAAPRDAPAVPERPAD